MYIRCNSLYRYHVYDMYLIINYYVRVYSRSFAKSANVGRRAAFRFCVVAVERRFRFVAVASSHPAKAQVTLASVGARTSKEPPTGNHSSSKLQPIVYNIL